MSMPRLNRRRFLIGLGTLAAAALVSPMAGLARAASPSLGTVTREGRALGSAIRLTVLHADASIADAAAMAALRELTEIDHLLSIYRPDSQLSTLNRTGTLESPDPRFLEVLHHAQAMSQRSGSAFDITVQPLWDLYATTTRAGRSPTAEELASTLARVGHQRVTLSTSRITLKPNTAITLNGIAQGYAADRALAALKSHGIEHALVDTGEIAPLGHNATGQPWTAGIQHPRHDDAYLALCRLGGRCLATSGDYATRFTPEHHHIFDPSTGHSARSLISVSVLAPTACLADALSTAVFALGPDRGLDLIRATPGADALLIKPDGKQLTTGNFPLASI